MALRPHDGKIEGAVEFQGDVTLTDDADNTKKVLLDVSGVTRDTTRTLSLPDATDTLAALAATQALTNKSINGVPTAETQALDPSQKQTFYDDFMGDLLADEWTAITGNDAQAVAAAISAGVLGGVVAMTSGDSNPGVTAADAAGLVLGRNWRASDGGLFMEARVKLDAITTARAFIGFTDTIALEFPAVFSGATLVAAADDAVGFLFDTVGNAPDDWYGVGVKATVVGARQDCGAAPAADTYDILRVEISSAGAATFYLNGTSVATLANAVTATTLLTPVLIVMEAGVAAVRVLTCDYVHVQKNRSAT